MENPEYVDIPQAFLGCPVDVESWADEVQAIWAQLPVPGVKREIFHWRKDYDAFAASSALPDQHRIARTSHPATSPVFILIGHTIGTPVRPPPEGWGEMRGWLDANGWGFVSLLGEPGFSDLDAPPDGATPLTGTVFELLDAIRSGEETFLRIYDLAGIADPPVGDPGALRRQWDQRERLFRNLSSYAVRRPASGDGFRRMVGEDLKRAFDLPRLDPRIDPLPGLDAIGADGLLFGRGPLIGDLTRRALSDPGATIVLGVGGTGKSSLLRSGLMGHWFSESPPGPGLRKGVHAIVVEPAMLVATPGDDPLAVFARLLFGSEAQPSERALGPLPAPLSPGTTLDPPPLTDDPVADLDAALAWWRAITAASRGRLVVVLDQAEQIEHAARREARARAERDGVEDETPSLSPAWRRFTGFVATLGGLREGTFADGDLTVHLVLSLHRFDALDLWPISWGRVPTPVEVMPLRSRAEWAEIVDGTCGAYGLQVEPSLRDKICQEAADLAAAHFAVREVDGADERHSHAEASVLPQVRTALQRMLTHWRDRFGSKAELEPDDLRIDVVRYGTFSDVAGSIEALGESAFGAWEAALADRRGMPLDDYFAAMALRRDLPRLFSDLMRGLIDIHEAERQSLTYLARRGGPADRNPELLQALRSFRLVTGTGRNHCRLAHRAVLDHWPRLAAWLQSEQPRLAAKRRLSAYRTLETSTWPSEDCEAFADLTLHWIGSGLGRDAELLDFAVSGLVAALDVDLVGQAEGGGMGQLLFRAAEAGPPELLSRLIDKCAQAAHWPVMAGPLLLRLSSTSRDDAIAQVLASRNDPQAFVDYVDPSSGHFPLLRAYGAGQAPVVRQLLRAGADPDRVHPELGSPLMVAAAFGDRDVVSALLEGGADAELTNPRDGTFPLVWATMRRPMAALPALLAAGVDPNRVRPATGAFALLGAVVKGDTEAVEVLIAHGADPMQVRAQTGQFPLLTAAALGLGDVAELLLKAGADPNQTNPTNGECPLGAAASEGHDAVVAVLLASGALPDRINPKTGSTPLMRAAYAGQVATVRQLLDAGADPLRIHRSSRQSVLQIAVKEGHSEVLEVLLAAGARL